MFIKYHLSYYALFIVLTVISILVHPIFFVFLVAYSIFIYFRLNFISLLTMLVLTIIFTMTMHYPSIETNNHLQGTIINRNKERIVLKTNNSKVIVYGEFLGFDIGDYLDIKVNYFDINEPTNDNAFNYRQYLYSQGITANGTLTNIITYQKKDTLLKKLLKRFEEDNLVNSYAKLFILGSRDELIEDYYQQLTDLSIVHLFALSGLHIYMLKGLIKKPLSFLLPEKILNYVCLIIIGVYLFNIPFNISFFRAYAIMVLTTLFNQYLNKLDALAIVTALMIYLNPYVIFNLSFIFSYFLYLLIILINRSKYLNLLIYLGSLPIILSIQYRINILSFILGIILTPLVTLLYQMLWLYTLFGSLFKPAASFVITILNQIIVFCNDFSLYLNFMKPPLFFILAFYFIYFKLIKKINLKLSVRKEALLLTSLVIMFYFKPYYQLSGQVVMIDVGQGDCFLIQQPFNQGNILIDTGGLRNKDVASLTVVPYLHSLGIFSLDYVFLSHDDFDHSGAYDSLASQIKIKETITAYQEKMKIGEVIIEMLALPASDNNNDSSLVMLVTVNHLKYLFTGDISSNVEAKIIQDYPNLQVDVLKVSHHGSNSGTSAPFLASIKPKVALISCGKNNTYGHPHDDLLQRLNDYGVKVYRTDQMGMVKIVYYGDDNYLFKKIN